MESKLDELKVDKISHGWDVEVQMLATEVAHHWKGCYWGDTSIFHMGAMIKCSDFKQI